MNAIDSVRLIADQKSPMMDPETARRIDDWFRAENDDLSNLKELLGLSGTCNGSLVDWVDNGHYAESPCDYDFKANALKEDQLSDERREALEGGARADVRRN